MLAQTRLRPGSAGHGLVCAPGERVSLALPFAMDFEIWDQAVEPDRWCDWRLLWSGGLVVEMNFLPAEQVPLS